MVILKFGGSSVGTPERINGVIEIIAAAHQQHTHIAVVVSAFSGVTDHLINTARLAASGDKRYHEEFLEIRERHLAAVETLISPGSERDGAKAAVLSKLQELHDLYFGIFLIRELSKRTLDFVCSFGERLSAYIIAQTISAQRKLKAEYLDARTVITTNDTFGSAAVNFEVSYASIQRYFLEHKDLQITTGFIASTPDGQTTTLGRGGSDYTAAILGAALRASTIEIWTDVDGVMTADPRKTKRAQTLERLTYEEAMELSHFGAKVIYPPTIQPAFDAQIPLSIRNTFNPSFTGTIIDKDGDTTSNLPVKGISSIKDIALLRIEGSGMIGVVGVSQRLFSALARERVNVILITQASSEHSICIAVEPSQAQSAARAIEAEFQSEISITRQVNPVIIESNLSILAIVGANMSHTPGIAGKVFQALGKNGVNVHAIAQGSSELNISVVVSQKDEIKAINAIHNDFFLAKTRILNLFVVGVGLIGKELLNKIFQQRDFLLRRHALVINVVGLATSNKMHFNEEGISLEFFEQVLETSGTTTNLGEYMETMNSFNLPNKVFVDNTAGEEVASLYETILSSNINVVTPNKKANTMSMEYYKRMRTAALRSGVSFLYETNVGAGLPVIDTLRNLVSSGDTIHRVQGVLSGTLSYVFNTYSAGQQFSNVIREAHKLGYTEPDPRDDLGGMDVARKLLIIAREVGYEMELQQVEVQSLTPASCADASGVQEFFAALEKENGTFESLQTEAAKEGKILRYIATLEHGKATTKLEAVDTSHPFYHLRASDNIFAITSEFYSNAPLVIQGPGAGAHVTAAGVLADILRVSTPA